jgi:hypothetical protein
MVKDDFDEIKSRYQNRLKKSFGDDKDSSKEQTDDISSDDVGVDSREYKQFRKESVPKVMSVYEKACNFSEKLVKIDPDKKDVEKLQDAIKTTHLEITPAGVTSFSVVGPLTFALVMIFLTYVLPSFFPGLEPSMFFVVVGVLGGLSLILPLQKIPYFMANSWRMKASNQMVLCIFYIVTYMRHTSNLERAINFAAEHLGAPLSLDLKKVIWNLESDKFSTLKESLDDYLATWRNYNMEFIESMHLIESSLYESSEARRVDALEKSLKVILDETYEKMIHYAHNLKGPLNALHMLGIILPILGLVILPLMVSFIPEVKWFHLLFFYNIFLPIIVYYLARNILSTRPTGYGESDISNNPELKKYKDIIIPIGSFELRISAFPIAVSVFLILAFIGLLPMIVHSFNPNFDIAYFSEGGLQVYDIENPPDSVAIFHFLDYREEKDEDGIATGKRIGPFGLGASIFSILLVIAIGVAGGLYYSLRSKNVIKIREQSKALEQEFASALFQLGNRIGDGIPAEIAFSKVSEVMEGTLSGKFFELVSINITKLGMSVEQAIFDPKKGAIVYYPSNLIESCMKVLVESSKKGPVIASQALINVSEYIKQIHRVDERLKDLMADIVSDMRSQVKFLTPAIAGIVVGITSMITQIIGFLSLKLSDLSSQAEAANVTQNTALLSMFGNGIPTFYFQFIVGLYVVQITFILSFLLNGIENGSDKLSERYITGKNLINTTITYALITLAVIILFNFISGSILSSFGS